MVDYFSHGPAVDVNASPLQLPLDPTFKLSAALRGGAKNCL